MNEFDPVEHARKVDEASRDPEINSGTVGYLAKKLSFSPVIIEDGKTRATAQLIEGWKR